MDHVRVAVAESERAGHHVGRDRTGWGVDFPLIEANLPGCLRHFLAGFGVNACVHAFATGEAIVGGGDEDITLVMPRFTTDNAEDTVTTSSCHVQFGHERPKGHEYI
jgi:hypothetical protein